MTQNAGDSLHGGLLLFGGLEMMKSGELPLQKQRYAVEEPGDMGGFKFCIIRKRVVPESDLPASDQGILTVKYAIRHVDGSPARW